ncbi:MAG TPA: GGDEF domain-containing protein [Gammaproteobacteria bacterium]|nr:GGDEF domain-containing protein [Gammaproteobacteria bacterium]
MDQEAAQWKQKYLDHLEESERREKQWRQSEELLRKTLSRLALAADGLDETLDQQLRALREAIRDRVDMQQLQMRIDDMSRTLVRIDQQGAEAVAGVEPENERRDAGREKARTGRRGLVGRLFGAKPREDTDPPRDKGGPDSVRDILLDLLERLTLPEAFSGRIEQIRARILNTREDGDWDAVLAAIADLVQAIRSQSQQEKQGIEDFLKQLGERLQEVDRQLVDSKTFYDDTLDAGQQLEGQVRDAISGIGDGVREATELGQLKMLVQDRMNAILDHLKRHREREQDRYDAASARIGDMSERLKSLEAETQQLRARVDEERAQAKTDALTGIPNRLAWEERLEQEVARWRRFGTALVIVVWDIDHFKQINDRFGHKAGDKVLRALARVLEDNIRETDFVARYGGEEFAQLMTGSSLEDSLKVADKLRAAIENTGFHFRDQRVKITASCGLAQFGEQDTPDSCFERADKALYRAKAAGRNRCETG